jgi:flagellar basal-body rod protein FlgB
MLSGIDLFRLTGDRMRYLSERQTVLARNIANADTPGYKAQDLAPFNVGATGLSNGTTAPVAAAGSQLTLARTSPGHIANGSAGSQPVQVVESAPDYGANASGNTVSLEQQMLKSADVSNAFALATAAYSKSLSLMKTAIDANH